jgi:hypothetical protein
LHRCDEAITREFACSTPNLPESKRERPVSGLPTSGRNRFIQFTFLAALHRNLNGALDMIGGCRANCS